MAILSPGNYRGALGTLDYLKQHHGFVEQYALASINYSRVFRCVNLLDSVPLLPTVSLASNSYLHCEKHMGPKGDEADESSALGLFRSFAGKAVEGVLQGTTLTDFRDAIKSRLSAHNMDAYSAMLKKL